MAIVLGLIAMSFVFWGIGDMLRSWSIRDMVRGYGPSTVIKIGSTQITIEQFRQIYNDRLQQLSRQFGRPITPEQARALGLEQQLARQLVSEAALDARARQLRLNVSDDDVARQIMADPSFKNAAGQFDPARFQLLLRNGGYTEARFTAEQRRLTLRRELGETISGDLNPPQTIADAINRYDNEQRAIDYVVLDASKAGEIPAPTPEVLAKYFEDNKALFRAPEYRSAVMLSVTANDIARPADVSDADARQFYEQNKARFGTPERRQIEQIVFPNVEEAAAAAARIEKQEITFAALATERGLSEKEIDLGLLTKDAMVDPGTADAAFALPEGGISAPVQGRFVVALVHVVKIEPAQVKPFEELSAEIKQAIAVDRAKSEIAARHDKIEDERAAGLKLSEIATKYNLTARTIEAIDRAGRDPNAQPIAGIPAGVDLVANIFSSDVGVENEPLQVTGGGSLWFDVTAVKPARDRALDEVRPQAEQRWRDQQVAERLRAKAKEMADKIKAGTSLADVAAAESVPVKTTFGLKRAGNTGPLPPTLIDAVFRTAKGEAGAAQGTSATEMIVFHLTDITVPAFDATTPEAKRVVDAMRRAFSDDLLNQYVARLQTDFGAFINLEALSRLSAPADQN